MLIVGRFSAPVRFSLSLTAYHSLILYHMSGCFFTNIFHFTSSKYFHFHLGKYYFVSGNISLDLPRSKEATADVSLGFHYRGVSEISTRLQSWSSGAPVAPVTIIFPVVSTLHCSNFTFLIICQTLYLMTQQKQGEMSGMFCVKFNLTSKENIA